MFSCLQRHLQNLVTTRSKVSVFPYERKGLHHLLTNGLGEEALECLIRHLLISRLRPADFLDSVDDVGRRVPASGCVDIFAE